LSLLSDGIRELFLGIISMETGASPASQARSILGRIYGSDQFLVYRSLIPGCSASKRRPVVTGYRCRSESSSGGFLPRRI